MRGAPARAVLVLPSASLGAELLAAHGAGPGRGVIEVGDRGLQRIVLAATPEGVQVVVETDQPREVEVLPVAGRALVIDLRRAGQPPDPTLPGLDLLAAVVEGRSLKALQARSAGDVPRIVLDPGHGGWDRGAVGPSGTAEADLALQFALRLAEHLRRELGAEVALTRDDDRYIPLRERAALANELGADLFLSIHVNAAPAPTVHGVETYYLDTASDVGAARVAARENRYATRAEEAVDPVLQQLRVAGVHRLSRDLALRVQREAVGALRGVFGDDLVRDLGVHTAVFAVLVEARMPAVLFESGFISNPEEELRLRHPRYEEALAEGLARAVASWLEARR